MTEPNLIMSNVLVTPRVIIIPKNRILGLAILKFTNPEKQIKPISSSPYPMIVRLVTPKKGLVFCQGYKR
jgi:hypothetical protein